MISPGKLTELTKQLADELDAAHHADGHPSPPEAPILVFADAVSVPSPYFAVIARNVVGTVLATVNKMAMAGMTVVAGLESVNNVPEGQPLVLFFKPTV